MFGDRKALLVEREKYEIGKRNNTQFSTRSIDDNFSNFPHNHCSNPSPVQRQQIQSAVEGLNIVLPLSHKMLLSNPEPEGLAAEFVK